MNDKNKKDSKAKDQLLKCFKECDTNGNGNLTFDEFLTMTKKIIEEQWFNGYIFLLFWNLYIDNL